MPPARKTIAWDRAAPARAVLLLGAEELLCERAQARIVAALREEDPELEVSELPAAGYRAGALAEACSPSLFAARRCIIVDGAEQAGDALLADLTSQLADSSGDAEDVTLVLRHKGGARGKKVVDVIAAAGLPIVGCEPIKRESDKESFAAREFVRARRTISAPAVRALVEAVGGDLRELAAACQQLMADSDGQIDKDFVDTYYQGRIEVTGFKVADAAVAGDGPGAVVLLRHALATGVDPVPINAAIAAKLRLLAKVAGARRRGLDPVADLGLSSWQVERAARELRVWDAKRLTAAIRAVAQADSDIKGESRSPTFALERAVLAVAAAARRPQAS